jgi:hypothetical protein
MQSRRDRQALKLDPPRKRSAEAKSWGSKERKADARANRRSRAAQVSQAARTAHLGEEKE